MKKTKESLKTQISAVNEFRESNHKNKLLYLKDAFDKSEKELKAEYNINYDLYKKTIKEIKKLKEQFIANFQDFDIDMNYFKSFKKEHTHIFKFLCEDKTIKNYIYKYYFSAIKTNNSNIAEEIKNVFDIKNSIKKDPRYLTAIKESALSIIKHHSQTANAKNIIIFANFLKEFEISSTLAKTFNIDSHVKKFLDYHNQ